MSAHAGTADLVPGKFLATSKMKTVVAAFILFGLAAMAYGLVKEPERLWHSYLTSFFYFANFAIGGLFFTALQFVAKAGWSVNVRRYAECMTSFFPFVVAGGLGLLFGLDYLYIWLNPEIVAGDHVLQIKSAYLNKEFFIVRVIIFLAMWVFFTKKIISNSLSQDQSADDNKTVKNVKWGTIFILGFAISYSLFSVDLLMSLAPHWYSTMFGVYCFSGLFQSSLAMIIVLTVHSMNKGYLRGFVNENHLHDLGKFLKAFTVFMAYIGFSQFMLIWYANLPEETEFYIHRAHGSWMAVSMAILFFKFVIPFLLLLPQSTKRNGSRLMFVAIMILAIQWVDIYWLVYPNFSSEGALFGFIEIGVFLGFLGIFLGCVYKFLAKNSLIPMNDPYRDESMRHHVVF